MIGSKLSRLVPLTTAIIALVSMVSFVFSTPSYAQVKPGDFITPGNATKVKDLVGPGVYYKVEHGMSMTIVPTQRIDWPPPFKDATEKYSSQVRLSNDRHGLVGFVAGQPFPLIDSNDPDVGAKIMWNNVFKPITSDDYDLRFYDCDTARVTSGSQTGQIEYFQIGHYAGYDLVGRTEVEPIPTDPDFKATGRLWLFALYPLLSPQDIHGTGFIRWRYADPNRGDDDWELAGGSRRVRRLNESIMSDQTGATEWNPDHYSGFNAKTEFYDYKYLGEKNLLACAHAAHSPEIRCPTDGGTSACPENWEMRHLYVVEAAPRRMRGKAGGVLDSKTVVYLDGEMWFPPYIDEYDQQGHLWVSHIWWTAYRDRPVPDARVAIYPFKRSFEVGALSSDVQSGLSSMCYLPGIETPERECWYINMGAVDRTFFTTDAMVRAAAF